MRERLDCRLCGGPVHSVFKFKDSPVANSFSDKPDHDAQKYPLELMQCGCGHVQQRVVLEGLFNGYKYRTPFAYREHLEPLAKWIADKYPQGRVLEIGCNNGTLLNCMMFEGLDCVGVDPSTDHEKGMPVCFTLERAKALGKFDVVVGLNVFAHIDNLDDVFAGIATVLEPDGMCVFEVQYLKDMVDRGEFDMVYHEHMSYHLLGPLVTFLLKHGMVMTDWTHLETHGGSIRVVARKYGEQCEVPDEFIDWAAFDRKLRQYKRRLPIVLRSHGKVVAFGATAKATTLINELGIAEHINFCVDDTPEKQFKFIPGTDIQILPVAALRDEPVLLTAWNYADKIAQRIPNRLINPFAS